jgi:hypothetical protein
MGAGTHTPFTHPVTPLPTPHPPAGHLPPEVLARLGNSRLVQRATAQGSGPPVQPPHKHLVANFGEAVPLGETRTM